MGTISKRETSMKDHINVWEVYNVSALKKNLNQQKLNKTNAFIPAETMTGRTLPNESDAAGTAPPAARQATLTPKTIGNPDVCVAMRPFRKLTFREFPRLQSRVPTKTNFTRTMCVVQQKPCDFV